jgi:hypothetical protein
MRALNQHTRPDPQLLAFLMPSPILSVAIFPAVIFIMVSFSGFVVLLPTIPDYLQWGTFVSLARWTNQVGRLCIPLVDDVVPVTIIPWFPPSQGLVLNEFEGNRRLLFNGFGVHNVPYSDFAYK